jgi:acyl-CoA synthetase (AMP-forming)/AMP-acid ligase II
MLSTGVCSDYDRLYIRNFSRRWRARQTTLLQMAGTLTRLWKATLRRDPAALAVTDPDGRGWTRCTLGASAEAWAAAHPAAAGCRVAMAVPNGAEWFEAFLGLLSVGAVPAPVDPAEPAAAQVAAARSIGARWIWRGGRLEAVGPARPAKPDPRRECLVKLTSGSSGSPRGLAFTHAQMEADGRQICASMGSGPDDANLALIPLGYSYGLGNLVIPLILQGSRVICSSSALPQAVAADARRTRPTVLPAVPPILAALAASDVPADSFASVRLVLSAGSPLAPEVGRAFAARFGIRIHGFYGTSETGGIAFDASGEATLEGRSVGTPIAGVRVAFGARGRFRVSSPAVVGRGHFTPADLAQPNGLGELVLLGRSDRVVKIGGRRVDLAEVEAGLRSVPGIRDAFAQPRGASGRTLSAAVASDLAGAEIRRLLGERLAPWKIPARIIVLKEFPRTARGKADARALRQMLDAPRTVASISTLSAERQMSAHR